MLETGEVPVNICPPGVAAGIVIHQNIKPTGRRTYFSTNVDFHTDGLWLRRLAQAKIMLALRDLASRSHRQDVAYCKTVAVQFIFGDELIYWCDDADICVDAVRRKAKEIMAGGNCYLPSEGVSRKVRKPRKKLLRRARGLAYDSE